MSTIKDSEELNLIKSAIYSGNAAAFNEYIELLIKFNNQQKEILQDTKEWLQNTNGNKKH